MQKRDFETHQKQFRDPAKIFRDPRFSRYHSPPLMELFLLYKRSMQFNLYFVSRMHVKPTKVCN